MADLVYTPLVHIDSKTIECNIPAFTIWLNDLVDQVNTNTQRIIQLIDLVEKLRNEVACLQEEINLLKERVTALEACCEEAKARLTEIENWQTTVNNRLDNLEDRVQWLYDHLPATTGLIPADFRFAMGNINVMSANGGTPSLNIGIFTSRQIENNDLYFR